ncbi:hypothetical protein ASG29_03940 [Sphingomonas sp. Leaf412]|uniref:hypothetical protein n=1 Tax=Sphingomonas sp. Leaf412 TaxID=1736370 RepID=UPI0006FDE756|nr:hypothetical protein [Sphingomonas sp. Leaf412]KQT35265.1 hypothetical protein ASG29_03940 [Sphingomonas sp. Leaf412]
MDADHDTRHPFRSATQESDYMRRRAEEHRVLADRTEEPGARSIHRRLQQLYQEQADLLMMVVPD